MPWRHLWSRLFPSAQSTADCRHVHSQTDIQGSTVEQLPVPRTAPECCLRRLVAAISCSGHTWRHALSMPCSHQWRHSDVTPANDVLELSNEQLFVLCDEYFTYFEIHRLGRCHVKLACYTTSMWRHWWRRRQQVHHVTSRDSIIS